MKFLSSAILVLSSAVSFAAEMPIVRKSNFYGFGPPERRQGELCEVFADRVEITRFAGEAKITEVRALSGARELVSMVGTAAGERETRKHNDMCDGPRTSVTAFAPASENGILLFDTGSCGADFLQREGDASGLLIWIVDQYCPTTFKPHLAP